MRFELKGLGPWGHKAGDMRADIACSSLEEFLTYPTILMIDERTYVKTAYHVQNKTAYYERSPAIGPFGPDTRGTFEVIDGTKEGQVRRTNITVEE